VSEARSVPLTEEQYLFVEDLGKEFMRAAQHETATKLLAIALAWRVSPTVREPLENDPEFRGWMEEAGMLAPVVELHGYSRKTPCA